MDHSWLHDDDKESCVESESNPDETEEELESRLYAIVHHNDLSKPLPPDLAKHYSVQSTSDGELLVTLNNPLDQIKAEELQLVGEDFSNNEENVHENGLTEENVTDNDIIIVSEPKEFQRHNKRFRYSDINIDEEIASKKLKGCELRSQLNKIKEKIDIGNKKLEDCELKSQLNKIKDKIRNNVRKSVVFLPSSRLNFERFNFRRCYKKQLSQFNHLKVPKNWTSEAFKNSSDWKIISTANSIEFGPKGTKLEKPLIVEKMMPALLRCNRNINPNILRSFASAVLKLSMKQVRKEEKKRRSEELKRVNTSGSDIVHNPLYMPYLENNFRNNQAQNNQFYGSISLNLSPFKPDMPLVDLVSEDEENDSFMTSTFPIKSRSEKIKAQIPKKWTKEMIKFYMEPTKSEKKFNLDAIHRDLRRKSKPSEWELKFDRSVQPISRDAHRRCRNCRHMGHMSKDCKKHKMCYICGERYHDNLACADVICRKCGVMDYCYGGLCANCYHSYDDNTSCNICGSNHHMTMNCPDTWRRYHATTEGELKIPEVVLENKRKFCCNCASKGHFSHNCPQPKADPSSSFVTNYCLTQEELGSTELVVPAQYRHFIQGQEADLFLQRLSNTSSAVIECDESCSGTHFRIQGTFEQCNKVKNDIEYYVNSRKRKRQEPPLPRNKKRRLH